MIIKSLMKSQSYIMEIEKTQNNFPRKNRKIKIKIFE
jgi:hypothetical protein